MPPRHSAARITQSGGAIICSSSWEMARGRLIALLSIIGPPATTARRGTPPEPHCMLAGTRSLFWPPRKAGLVWTGRGGAAVLPPHSALRSIPLFPASPQPAPKLALAQQQQQPDLVPPSGRAGCGSSGQQWPPPSPVGQCWWVMYPPRRPFV